MAYNKKSDIIQCLKAYKKLAQIKTAWSWVSLCTLFCKAITLEILALKCFLSEGVFRYAHTTKQGHDFDGLYSLVANSHTAFSTSYCAEMK